MTEKEKELTSGIKLLELALGKLGNEITYFEECVVEEYGDDSGVAAGDCVPGKGCGPCWIKWALREVNKNQVPR